MILKTSQLSLPSLLQTGLIAGVTAASINIVLYFFGQAINGGPMMVLTPNSMAAQALPLIMVIMLSIIPAVVAALLYWILLRYINRRANLIFSLIALIIFILFIFGPLQAAQGLTSIIVLEIMHLAVAIPVLWMLFRKTNLS